MIISNCDFDGVDGVDGVDEVDRSSAAVKLR